MHPGLLLAFLFLCFFVLTMIYDNLWSGAPASFVAKLKMSWSRKEAFERTQPWGFQIHLLIVRIESHRMSDFEMQIPLLSPAVDEFKWLKNCLLLFPFPDSPRFSAANLIAASNTIHLRVHRNAKIGNKKHTPSKTCPWSQKGKPLSPGFHGKQCKASHCTHLATCTWNVGAPDVFAGEMCSFS